MTAHQLSLNFKFVFYGRCLWMIPTSCLVTSVTSLYSYNRHNSPLHWLNVLLKEECVRHGLPFFGQGCLQILQCVGLMIFPGPPTQLITNVFDWVLIRRYDRTRKNISVFLCQKLSCNEGGVGSCIFMLESDTGTQAMEKWYGMRTQDVVDITISIIVTLYQVRLLATHYPIPNHQTAPTNSIPFQHTTVPITLVCAAINPSSTISITKRKSGFVTEKPCSSRYAAIWNEV